MTVASTTSGNPSIAGPLVRSRTEAALVGTILFCLALQLHLAFTKAINWDEFRFLADVHRYSRGELSEALQTFHVHFFGWLLWLPVDEVGQIIAARLVMLALECGTIALIYGCARRFMPVQAALIGALAYAGFSFVVGHGASFRFDPPSIALLMAAAFLLLEPSLRIRSMLLTGLAVAVAGLITIKSALMLPTLAVLAFGRMVTSRDRPATLARLGVAAATCFVAFACLYAAHQDSLLAAGFDASRGLVEHSAGKTLGHGGILPNGGTALLAVIGNPVVWLLIMAGLGQAAVIAARPNGADRVRAVMLLAFAAPLLTPIFYRNAYPYYFAWIMAPAALLAGFGALQATAPKRAGTIALLLGGTALIHHQAAATPILAAQRATIAAVHVMFPSPVAYIDRASMIGSFDKVGLFMSSWGMEVYRANGRPVMRDILRTSAPPLLIANSPALEVALMSKGVPDQNGLLLAADAAVLRANFIHHWGPLWVAGKELDLTLEPHHFEVAVPGTYTIEGASPVRLDGAALRPNDVVKLAAGSHWIASVDGRQSVRLRWGDHLTRLAAPPPVHPLFAGF